MKISVTQEKFSKALNIVSHVAVGKVTLPILNNVLIRVDQKKVSLITTNLDMAVVDFLPVSDSEDGVITVPAKLLAEFVNNLPRDEKITIETKDNKVTISAGNYESTINGAPADDFPEIPEIAKDSSVTCKLDINEFKAGLISTIVACSTDLTRPSLTGVYFSTQENDLCIAATDGYRLTEKILLPGIDSDISAVVPASSLQEVLRSITDDLDEICLTFSQDLVSFRLGEIEIISKLIDAPFPEYRTLLPKTAGITVPLDRSELIRVTKLAALFSRASGGSIICETKLPDSFYVKSIANEYGENDSKITVTVPEDGEVSLNSRYLLDALNVLNASTVDFSFTDHHSSNTDRHSPVILKNHKDPSYTHVIMPLST